MEQKENDFLGDVLNILPEKIDCFIQAPSLKNDVIKEMLQNRILLIVNNCDLMK